MAQVLEEYDVAEDELFSHIGIFLENNASLLETASIEDSAASYPAKGPRQQQMARVRDQPKKIKKTNVAPLGGEPIRKVKK